jgi:hypothetical protein
VVVAVGRRIHQCIINMDTHLLLTILFLLDTLRVLHLIHDMVDYIVHHTSTPTALFLLTIHHKGWDLPEEQRMKLMMIIMD